MNIRFAILAFFGCLAATALVTVVTAADDHPLGDLHWRLVGPFRGGRALAVTGVPGDPDHFYFGSVGGGVWESHNSGRTWVPIFDSVRVASIGAIAVANSDPNVIYVGTGEADMRADIQQGSGMYKSIDAGKTWTFIGLEDTRQIGRIIVNPHNANMVYVAALGHQYGANEERGVFKTADGGASWKKVLYKSPDVGAIDLCADPTNFDTVYASLWQTRRPPWTIYPPSNGPGSGLFKTTDGGASWVQIKGHGFPGGVGHVGIAVAPSDPRRVYALADAIDESDGGMYRSDDSGATWRHTNEDTRIWGRGWYFEQVTVDPRNPDEVYAMNTSAYRSVDAGKSFIPFKGAPGGDDNHALWIDPENTNHMILGSDQGVVVSVDGGKTWSSWYNQPIGQFYHIVTDDRFPYWIYGSQQDSGAMALPNRTIHTGISAMYQRPISEGGESGTIATDPLHPGLIYSNSGGREQLETGWTQNSNPTGQHPEETWRKTWTTPIARSPIDPKVFYLSHQQIFRTDNEGATWTLISPDLTRPTTTVPANLDPTTAADSDGSQRRAVVYWIAPSPFKLHEIWAGTDDGKIWLTRNEGANWEDVTPAALTPWSKVGVIDASHFDAETAYAAIDRHRLEDNRPYIYKTHDGGKSWSLITNGIPDGDFINVVREDPHRSGLLYAGSDRGIFVSLDDGANWQSLQYNLPAASVRDIVFGPNGDIIVATHGRAIWAMDTPVTLRQIKGSIGSSSPMLFKPDPVVQFQHANGFGGGTMDEGTPFPPEEPQGQNPAIGAPIDYVVPDPASTISFSVTDSKGREVGKFATSDRPQQVNVRQLDIPAYWVHPVQPASNLPGTHRYYWSMRYRNDRGPQLPPGRYTVHMNVNGQTLSQPLTIVRDPRLHDSDEGLQAQFELWLQEGDELSSIQKAISKIDDAAEPSNVKVSPAERARLQKILGSSVRDIGSLRYLVSVISSVRGSLGSAPATPNPEAVKFYRSLRGQADRLIAEAKVK